MDIFIVIFVIIQVIVFIIQIVSIGLLLTDSWSNSLEDYFPTRQLGILFFIPIIGFYVFIYFAIVKRLNESYPENEKE